MQTRDHRLLSNYLLNNSVIYIPENIRPFFIWGSIEPDYNVFTYLRGSIRKQVLRGHNYDNVIDSINSLITRLQDGMKNKYSYFYLLGKLIHYVADAFTFPHNKEFEGSLAEHCRYEHKLHNEMKNIMINSSETQYSTSRLRHAGREMGIFLNMSKLISKTHEYYIGFHEKYRRRGQWLAGREEKLVIRMDCEYILHSVQTVFEHFLMEETMLAPCTVYLRNVALNS